MILTLTDAQAAILKAMREGAILERICPTGEPHSPAYSLGGTRTPAVRVEGLEAQGHIRARSPRLIEEFGYSLYSLEASGLSALSAWEASEADGRQG